MSFIKGEPCTIQGAKSDVILSVPKGVYGVVLSKIHTNNARFQKHIRTQECLISPVCEYLLYPYLEDDPIVPPDQRNRSAIDAEHEYTLQIPHIVEDVDKVREYIRVKHGNIQGDVPLHSMEAAELSPEYFGIDKSYVYIYTRHFSGFIVTADGINCCGRSIFALIFGSLKKISGEYPLTILKVFLASKHYNGTDYIAVSTVFIRSILKMFTLVNDLVNLNHILLNGR